MCACRAPERVQGKAFNIACHQEVTLLDLLAILEDILGTKADPEFLDPRPGDVRHSLADIRAAEQELGYCPQGSLREGLSKTIDWFKG